MNPINFIRSTTPGFAVAECLGCPLPPETPNAGKRIVDLQHFNSKTYVGYGNWSPNSGPVDIICWNGTEFVKENCGGTPTLSEEEVWYVTTNNCLYIPGIDPKENWELGNFYRYEASGWIKYRTIPNGIHTFAIAEYNGSLFVGCGVSATTAEFALQRSDEGGTTEEGWDCVVDPNDLSGINRPRFNQLIVVQDKLVAVGFSDTKGRVFVYDCQQRMMQPSSWQILGNRTSEVAIKKSIVLQNSVFAITSTKDELYMAQYNQPGRPLPKHNSTESIMDVVAHENVGYVLASSSSSAGGYDVGICSFNSSGINTGHVGTRLPYQPLSLAVSDTDILLGDNEGYVYRISR